MADDLTKLGNELSNLHQAILRTESNFKKIPIAKRNVTTTKVRLELLKEKWSKCQDLDTKIHNLAKSEEKLTLDYFVKNQFLTIEDAFLNAYDFINDHINNYVSQPDLNSSSREISLQHKVNNPKLPKINIASFSGNYADWENFRDLFEALIVRNDSLSSIV